MGSQENRTLHTVRLGRTEYRWCLEVQRRAFALRSAGSIPDVLLLTEHDPVFTIGRSGNPDHVLAGDAERLDQGIDLVSVERGGDVTYHGPGQLVGYPILDLHGFQPDLHRYLRDLEETVIRVLGRFSVRAERHPSYTGVWAGGDKICAIGIHTSRWITMHGFALNVCADLQPFGRIIPCGIFEQGVTSMENLLGCRVPLEEVTGACIEEFALVFRVSAKEVGAGAFLESLHGLAPTSGRAGDATAAFFEPRDTLTCTGNP